MAKDADTTKIVRSRRFGGAGAPTAPSQETPSGLLQGIVDDTLAIGRSEKPSEDDVARLRNNLGALLSLAQAGIHARNGWVRTLVVGLMAMLGIPAGVVIADDGSEIADSAARAAQNETALEGHEARIAKLEQENDEIEQRQQDEERRARRVQGLTVRWLGDTQTKQCEALDAIAKAIDPKLEVDCGAATLPPELVRLVADLDIEEEAARR